MVLNSMSGMTQFGHDILSFSLYLIIILGILVFVHELGHFIAAKKIGVYVSEFAVGMGPKIFSFKRKNKNDPTIYSLRLFPLFNKN